MACQWGLQGADRVDFGDDDAGAAVAQRRGRALADVAEAGDTGDLAGEHDVGAAANGVDQRLLAAVEIVELRLGDAVVDVDRRERELALLCELVEAVDAGGGLFRDALDRLYGLRQEARRRRDARADDLLEDLLFLILRRRELLPGPHSPRPGGGP